MRHLLPVLTACAAIATVVASPAQAIIRYGSMNRAITAPTGAYANSGWQYTGIIANNNVAWPISPNWALRATHTTGGGALETIMLNGVAHPIVENVPLVGTDVTLVRVENAFSTFAPMYQGGGEVGEEMMVIGRGFSVKDQPIVAEITGRNVGHTFKNADADGDHVLAWGRNRVRDARELNINGVVTDILYATYDKPTLDDGSPNPNSEGADEALAAPGDSGGGVFIRQDNEWRLAGLVWAIDAGIYYNETSGAPYWGAISDYRDMWVDKQGGGRELVTGPDPLGAGFYASRVSTYREFIDTTTGQTRDLGTVVPEAGTAPLALLGGAGVAFAALVRRRRAASVA